MKINFMMQIWEEDEMFVGYAPQLDISSCGKSPEEARKNLKEAVSALLEETQRQGTINDILKEAGFLPKDKNNWKAPDILSSEKVNLVL